MDDGMLELLLNDLESDRVERKASIASPDKIRQAICAFANDLPNHGEAGVLFIGVNDDGGCANLPITDQLLKTLAGWRSDGNILPFPMITVQKRNIAGCELAVILVEPAYAPPVRCRGLVWVRVGPRRATATSGEERRLAEKRRANDLPYDIQILFSADMEDLDLDLFCKEYLPSVLPPEILEENNRSIEQQLISARFAVNEPPVTPTVLGLLVIGKNPRYLVPSAYIQFIRFDGIEETDPIKDQAEIIGSLAMMLRLVDEKLQSHISIALNITARPTEIRQPDYPIAALQQLTRNAVLHRTYEGTHAPVRISWFNDRIEIQNPGGPFGQINRQNFGLAGITDYRNPHLAEAMKNLGYIQRFGLGIPLARKKMEENGNSPPEFTVEEAHVLVIVRKRT
ncbi:MAG: transcriptional regulator [Gammaproteobacteria bacterium]|nr:transcriptional regulator [Gammaproteobacteria bacterium]